MSEKPNYKTIGEYIETCGSSGRPVLRELCAFIKDRAPESTDKISCSMPCFYQKGNLVYFAAAKNHTGFYPGTSGIANFTTDFDALRLSYSKGAGQFPIGKPLPWELIGRIAAFRVRKNTQ